MATIQHPAFERVTLDVPDHRVEHWRAAGWRVPDLPATDPSPAPEQDPEPIDLDDEDADSE